jgi:Fe-S cluster assembly protein SufD
MSLTTTDKNLTSQIIASIQEKVAASGDPARLEALAALQTTGLPSTKHEEYKHTAFTRELEKNFTFTKNATTASQTNISDFLIPYKDADIIVFLNGRFSKEQSAISSDSGIKILSITEALASNETAREHFGKLVTGKMDGYTAWNTAAWTDGLYIEVPNNTIAERPIFIHYINDASAGEVASFTRNLFVIGKSSQVTLIEKLDSVGDNNHFQNYACEILVNENAGLNLYSIQNDLGKRYQHAVTDINQKKSSRVNTYTFTLSGKMIRNNLTLALDGEGIESHMYGLYLTGGDTIADNHTVVDHRKPNSFSNELYKGIMDGQSRGIFNGKIYVRPHAQKTNAFQANRNILLTDKASVNTKPQLEIWADDVKCSHGCTSGQLDEEALFYLRSRGISKEIAQAMMLYAFAGEVLDNVKDPALKEYLDTLISERLHKTF